MRAPEEILINKEVLIPGADRFPFNLTRDGHVGTKKAILEAMQEYAEEYHRSQINKMCSECGGVVSSDEPIFCTLSCFEKYHDAKLTNNL